MCFSAVVYYLSDLRSGSNINPAVQGFLSCPVFTWDLGSKVKGGANPAGWTTAALRHFLSVSLHEKRRFGLRMSEQELIRERGAKDSRKVFRMNPAVI